MTYPWASQGHPSPSGRKMHELAEQLHKLGAKPTDAVFMDFCSLPQRFREGADFEKSRNLYKKQLKLDVVSLNRTCEEER